MVKLRDLLIIFLLSYCISTPTLATAVVEGVAVDPMTVSVMSNRQVMVRIFNNTDNDYIVTANVDSNKNTQKGEGRFITNPPIRQLNKRSDYFLGVIYIPGQDKDKDNVKEESFLFISFIPKNNDVILTHQVPIRIRK